jgi:CBS domain-containing protein
MVKQLRRVAQDIEQGASVAPITVREFLSWYGAERRGQNVVANIRQDLNSRGLNTEPDFEGVWIDGLIEFVKFAPDQAVAKSLNEQPDIIIDIASSLELEGIIAQRLERDWISHDPTHQISKLAAANQDVKVVAPNDTISRAVTKMLMHNFSQLPVVTGERSLQGVISWKSIGSHLSLRREGVEVRHAMEQAQTVRPDASIFDVLAVVAKHDYVIVRDSANKIAGIVTATDLSEQFRNLSEPFLLLSEIENHLRNMIGDRVTVSELSEAQDPSDLREIKRIADLTFGEYVRLLENPDMWARLELEIDRAYFCERLQFVRNIRNFVMHFDPDGIEKERLTELREFSGALRVLQRT